MGKIVVDKNIDGGVPFDWGRSAADYAKYRDIYPQIFYDKILERKLCVAPQKVLDLGTGTGVLPRNMNRYGAEWTGIDISEEQIHQAERLSIGRNIKYRTVSAENIDFPDKSFDVITACQCFFYFDHKRIMPELCRILKPEGHLLVLYMAWLPFEDKIAGESERLILKFSPTWSGRDERMRPIEIPDCYGAKFKCVYRGEYKLNVRFTRESWHGRVRACRAIGASLPPEKLSEWEREHIQMLSRIAPPEFDVLHYAAIADLRLK